MRRLILLACIALAACGPRGAQKQDSESAPAEPRLEAACNTVVPNFTAPVRLGPQAAAAAADLAGGPIAPGTYDLRGGHVEGGAPAWPEDRYVRLVVTESESGVVFDWAMANRGGDLERWSGVFNEGPPARLAFSCGRDGEADITVAPSSDALQLRLPDASGGALMLLFTRAS